MAYCTNDVPSDFVPQIFENLWLDTLIIESLNFDGPRV